MRASSMRTRSMRAGMRTALCGLALYAAVPSGAALAAEPAPACEAEALRALRAASPNGESVYRQLGDRSFFRVWLDCEDAQFGLPTAVHESVHHLTADTDAYPLVGGGTVARPPEDAALFAPSRLARRFRPGTLVEAYLKPGGATSATDFRYLLDELNAYTHDLDAALALEPLRDPEVRPAHRDGLAALMSFVALYVEAAEADTAARAALKRPRMRAAVTALWGQAERTMTASCPVPGIGVEDRGFLTTLCGPGPQAALGQLLGRAPVCPRACLSGPRTASRE